MAGHWNEMNFKMPSNSNHSMSYDLSKLLLDGEEPHSLVGFHSPNRCEGLEPGGGQALFSGNKRQDKGGGLKLHQGRFRLDIREKFFI